MNENQDERLVKAAMKSLLVTAPDSLKADLKRLSRNLKPAPSIWDGLREAVAGGSWAYGAGAAFAAAAVGIVILRAVPEPTGDGEAAPTGVAEAPARRAADVPEALRDLWLDDDGGDHDDI